MKVWLQRADFFEQEFDLDLESTLRKLENFDWLAELAREQELANNGEESCPPGMGIVHPQGRILHICPNPSGATVHYHFPGKLMGMFSRQKSIAKEDVPPQQVKAFIHAFFEQQWDVIENDI